MHYIYSGAHYANLSNPIRHGRSGLFGVVSIIENTFKLEQGFHVKYNNAVLRFGKKNQVGPDESSWIMMHYCKPTFETATLETLLKSILSPTSKLYWPSNCISNF